MPFTPERSRELMREYSAPTGAGWRMPADIECTCAHLRHFHQDGTGACRGTSDDLDPQYGIPAGQPCACRSFGLDMSADATWRNYRNGEGE